MQLQVENTLLFVDSIIICAFLAIQNIPNLKLSVINTKYAKNHCFFGGHSAVHTGSFTCQNEILCFPSLCPSQQSQNPQNECYRASLLSMRQQHLLHMNTISKPCYWSGMIIALINRKGLSCFSNIIWDVISLIHSTASTGSCPDEFQQRMKTAKTADSQIILKLLLTYFINKSIVEFSANFTKTFRLWLRILSVWEPLAAEKAKIWSSFLNKECWAPSVLGGSCVLLSSLLSHWLSHNPFLSILETCSSPAAELLSISADSNVWTTSQL